MVGRRNRDCIDILERQDLAKVALDGGRVPKISLSGHSDFRKRFPDVKIVTGEEDILNDSSIQLVLSSKIASQHAALGVKVMKAGKDYLSDKPASLPSNSLPRCARPSPRRSGSTASCTVSGSRSRLQWQPENWSSREPSDDLLQTINIAPHQVVQGAGGVAGGSGGRPDWFWEPELYGGILTDIGSHQVDQFLFYTGSTEAEIVESQVANVAHPERPRFQDFGDMVLRGNRGLGYVRLD